MRGWRCGCAGQEQRRRHGAARGTRRHAVARLRVRPEHVAARGPRAGGAFPVVLFDHVGAGKSDLSAWSEQRYGSLRGYADDVRRAGAGAGPAATAVFVGHSVSAMIGVLAVADDPDAIAGLVLLTPSPRYIDDEGYRGGFSAGRHRRAAGVARQQLPRLVRRDGAGDHGQPGPPGAGAGADQQLLPHRPADRAGSSPGRRSCPTTAPTCRRSPCRRWSSRPRTTPSPPGGRGLRARRGPRQPLGHPRRRRALPAAQRPRGDG